MLAGSAMSEPTDVLPFTDFENRPLPTLVDAQDLKQPEKAKKILFIIPSSRRRIELELTHQIRIGRADPEAQIMPELDLTQDQGIENGISRLHATLQLVKQGVILVDLDSTNGTSLNRSRLPAKKPFLVKSGDEIKLGDLLIHIFFE
jgi:pSer/pThr/pTyr-binding forkhead associated (FHA) protein